MVYAARVIHAAPLLGPTNIKQRRTVDSFVGLLRTCPAHILLADTSYYVHAGRQPCHQNHWPCRFANVLSSVLLISVSPNQFGRSCEPGTQCGWLAGSFPTNKPQQLPFVRGTHVRRCAQMWPVIPRRPGQKHQRSSLLWWSIAYCT